MTKYSSSNLPTTVTLTLAECAVFDIPANNVLSVDPPKSLMRVGVVVIITNAWKYNFHFTE